MSLKDKVICISGCSRGIGLAMAKKAASDGLDTASQDVRHWHDCQRDQPQCGRLSVQAGRAVEAGLDTASQDTTRV